MHARRRPPVLASCERAQLLPRPATPPLRLGCARPRVASARAQPHIGPAAPPCSRRPRGPAPALRWSAGDGRHDRCGRGWRREVRPRGGRARVQGPRTSPRVSSTTSFTWLRKSDDVAFTRSSNSSCKASRPRWRSLNWFWGARRGKKRGTSDWSRSGFWSPTTGGEAYLQEHQAALRHFFLPLHHIVLLVEVGGDDGDGDGEHQDPGEAGDHSDDAAAEGDGDHVAVADRGHGDDGPPEGGGNALGAITKGCELRQDTGAAPTGVGARRAQRRTENGDSVPSWRTKTPVDSSHSPRSTR